MIRFENAVKRYTSRGESKWILRGLNMELPRGRSIGILGYNGAGKSTLIRMISGAEEPDFGTIHRDLKISWPLGFGGSIAGNMSGHDACMFVSRLYDMDPHRVIHFVQDFSELGPYFFEATSSYSSGMKARLTFGLSMAVDFDCYLVDEITAVGDSRFKAKCLAAFNERRKYADIIMVSHSEKTIRDYCDMGAILADGELTLYDDLDQAMSLYREMMEQ
ncbi:ABC transporter ATP-binding protein [Chthonobacter rhizosphaerae]|uniref:ABC transporter ATP-binding protein n=1 Tax=Chthonobacter rhizosphaerae TaxID=2735553 RepID=UPI0015EF9B4F|nr:ABC transporter ATP-binding protein [Chthonobacter rhizosphaerae]